MKSYYGNIREEELKNKVGKDWFDEYDWTGIVGNIDFSVALKTEEGGQKRLWDETEFLLWAEAKQGTKHDIYESFVQLILTIGKAHTIDRYLPPIFLGAFDAEKIAFIPYNAVMEVFSQNDFNWNVTPSNHTTKEFIQLQELVKNTLEENAYLYHYDTDAVELRNFIRNNFRLNKESVSTIRINKNNFTHIYLKWLREVKPSLDVVWDEVKNEGLIDADFYLADILSENNATIREKLFVLLKNDHYLFNIHRRATGTLQYDRVDFNDHQKAHKRFWKRYARPPKEEYWNHIVNRRDLLVPQDIRERRGSFFTPSKWVELSQEYIARELGENWQDEYYVWDCCAGTGNLLAGLTEKYRIFASTLDNADVSVMKDLIKSNSLNLLDTHVFQFDFLNDELDSSKRNEPIKCVNPKIPKALRDIINDPEKRKKLIIYINPPYAEAANVLQRLGRGVNIGGVATGHTAYMNYISTIRMAARELFTLFFIRIYCEIEGCILAEFSKLKFLQSSNFRVFRDVFQARLGKSFVVPANTFDNVKGQFPIGFFIWYTTEKEIFEKTLMDVYDKTGSFLGQRELNSYKDRRLITDWMKEAHDNKNPRLAYLRMIGSDVYNGNGVFLTITPTANDLKKHLLCNITERNLLARCVYFYVRHCLKTYWLINDEQFLYPYDTWKEDIEFQRDCLAYTLFSGWNCISVSQGGINNFIPFTEDEVGAKEGFESHFMSDFIKGKRQIQEKDTEDKEGNLFNNETSIMAPQTESKSLSQPIVFSKEATAVMDAGRELWRYYHQQPKANINASFYDIRKHFQGVDKDGKMNSESTDAEYMVRINHLRRCMKVLAEKIAPKVYEHGFLMGSADETMR